ncbi:MAG: restriction endonuclease subunit S [Candidatus Eisenbacteria bacterium]|nr:restriction endonuclease subunit S [Candidatus Eisenbacteria bacterium]
MEDQHSVRGLPENWQVKPLSAFNARRPVTINPASSAEETFEYYSIPAYQDDQRPTLAKGNKIGSSKLLLDSGTVLFGKLNPRVEKVWRVGNYSPHRKIGSTEWLPLVPSNDVDEQFLYFLLWSEHVMAKAKTLVSGSTPSRQRVDPRSFYRIEAPLPPLREQQKIAGVLGLVRRAIEQQERLIALTTELKKALLHQLFTQGLHGEPQKQTEIGPVPQSWEVRAIGDLFRFSSGKSRPKDTEATASSSKPFPVFGGNGILGYSGSYLYERPLLLLGRVGEYCGCAHHTEGRAWVSDNALYAKEILGDIDTLYAVEYLAYANLNQYSNRAGQPLITQGIISEVKMPLPPLDQQREILEPLQLLNRKLTNYRAKSEALTALFRTLLHQLMTAQIRVHDLELSELEIAQ